MPTTAQRVPEAARRAWSRALRDLPEDLPYKVETNARGNLILSPPRPEHGMSQGSMVTLLGKHVHENGRTGVEIAVETSDGIKVSDVAWISEDRWARVPAGAEASPVMPEICVEVLSDSNTEAQMVTKRRLYFEGRAREVWTLDQEGHVRFFGPDGPRERSVLAPNFPAKVTL